MSKFKQNLDVAYNNAIAYYNQLQHKKSNGVLTDNEITFLQYIDIHCYSGYNRSKPSENPSDYIKNKIVDMKSDLFI